ncbi:MAG: 30S ribosomal protein S16 [Chlamydiae bacterium]|nr:30S ribosomal protein S16 [Chlamydiota bacterium]
MALKIRLRQQGRNNYQTYRLVVADSRYPRDGKYLEMLGWYNPGLKEGNVSVNAERVSHWVKLGAVLSERVKSLLAKSAPSVLQELNARALAKKQKVASKPKKQVVAKTKEASKPKAADAKPKAAAKPRAPRKPKVAE